MRKRIFACLMVLPTLVLAQPHDFDERKEVVAMFAVLLPKFDVKKGDGLGSNVDCVFSLKWDQSYHRDVDGEPTEAFQPRELLTIEQALDPLGQHKGMFCEYPERDDQAQKLAQDKNKSIAVASIGLSYPDFGPDLTTATVYYQRWSKLFLAGNKKDLPVGSNGVITFRKHGDSWSFELVHLGTMN